MANGLSEWGRGFLSEVRVAVMSTLNKDGSSHVTTIWYLLEMDGGVSICTSRQSKKSKNLHRDPRIALCVGDAGSSVSLYGQVSFLDDPVAVRQTMEALAERYVAEPELRPRAIQNVLERDPEILHFLPEKISEFSTVTHSSILNR